ncbi:MAG: hypothetical protein IH944_01275 [Armatimonadetes bacterium]|nr:hypothetical protein [Armatimonadota bacterium]
MTFRIKSAVAVAAFLSLMLLGACGPTEEATNDDGETTPVASNGGGDGGGGEVDLSTVDVKAAVHSQMMTAEEAGMYDCCLVMPCTFCMVLMGSCPCEENAKSDGKVCRECKGGWDAGGGGIDGMTTDDINVMPPMMGDMDMDGM